MAGQTLTKKNAMTQTIEAPKPPYRTVRAMTRKQNPMPTAPMIIAHRFPILWRTKKGMTAEARYPGKKRKRVRIRLLYGT
jgi:hypothetical protein